MAGKIEIHPASFETPEKALTYGKAYEAYGYEILGTVPSKDYPGRHHLKLRNNRKPKASDA